MTCASWKRFRKNIRKSLEPGPSARKILKLAKKILKKFEKKFGAWKKIERNFGAQKKI